MQTGIARRSRLFLFTSLALAAACSSNDNGGPGPSPTTAIQRAPTADGNNQSGTAGQALPNPLRVLVTQNGSPMAGATVTWGAATGSGALTPGGATGSDGIASATWTLGATVGSQTATASLQGATGSPLQFTAVAAAPGGGGGGGGGVSTNAVTVENDVFSPGTIQVPVGTTVTWTWANGAVQHNIAPDSPGAPSEPTISSAPFTYQFTFTAAGTYNYHCTVHGAPGAGMHGTVIVQ